MTRIALVLLGLVLLAVLGHLAVIEIGRDVAVLRTPTPDGGWQQTRLWIVDDGDVAWLHSKGADWERRFEGDPVVEVERHGEARRLRAHVDPEAHAMVDRLLRAKYGWADRWVRFLAPCDDAVIPVRLEPLPPPVD